MSVSFENGSGQRSAIYWHGIHLDNAMDGVPGLTQAAIEPGKTLRYAFDVPHAGTYWYHAHHRSWEQVARGLYGPLIVEEPDPPAVDHDITIVLDDWRLERSGELHESFGNRHDFSHAERVGNVARALFSRDTVRRGDRIRLRLIQCGHGEDVPGEHRRGTAVSNARISMTSTIEVSSTTRSPQSRGLSALRLTPPPPRPWDLPQAAGGSSWPRTRWPPSSVFILDLLPAVSWVMWEPTLPYVLRVEARAPYIDDTDVHVHALNTLGPRSNVLSTVD